MVERLLNQAESDGSIPISPLQFQVERVSYKLAKKFIEEWHYSHKFPNGQNVAFGVWHNEFLYAVISYGVGVNPYQEKFLNVKKAFEIKRMARIEPKMPFPLSRFISITIRELRKLYSIDAIVAFADPEHGHSGTVYKAAGFKNEGVTTNEWHCVDKDGNIVHRRRAYRYAKYHNITIQEARKELGLTTVKHQAKLRWVKRF